VAEGSPEGAKDEEGEAEELGDTLTEEEAKELVFSTQGEWERRVAGPLSLARAFSARALICPEYDQQGCTLRG